MPFATSLYSIKAFQREGRPNRGFQFKAGSKPSMTDLPSQPNKLHCLEWLRKIAQNQAVAKYPEVSMVRESGGPCMRTHLTPSASIILGAALVVAVPSAASAQSTAVPHINAETHAAIDADWGPLARMAGSAWSVTDGTYAARYEWVEYGRKLRATPLHRDPNYKNVIDYELVGRGRISYYDPAVPSDQRIKDIMHLQPDGSYTSTYGHRQHYHVDGDVVRITGALTTTMLRVPARFENKAAERMKVAAERFKSKVAQDVRQAQAEQREFEAELASWSAQARVEHEEVVAQNEAETAKRWAEISSVAASSNPSTSSPAGSSDSGAGAGEPKQSSGTGRFSNEGKGIYQFFLTIPVDTGDGMVGLTKCVSNIVSMPAPAGWPHNTAAAEEIARGYFERFLRACARTAPPTGVNPPYIAYKMYDKGGELEAAHAQSLRAGKNFEVEM